MAVPVSYHLMRSGRTVAPLCAKRGVRGGPVLRGSACGAKFATFEPRAQGIDTFDGLAGRFDSRLAAGSRDRRHMRRLTCAQIPGARATATATDAPALVDGPVEQDTAAFEVHGTSIH